MTVDRHRAQSLLAKAATHYVLESWESRLHEAFHLVKGDPHEEKATRIIGRGEVS